MELTSVIRNQTPDSVVLSTNLDGEQITVYVVIAPPNLELLPAIVGKKTFNVHTQVHANSIAEDDMVEDKLLEVLENINPGDTAVFLCETQVVCNVALDGLGIVQ